MPQSLHRVLCLPVTLFNAWKVVKSKNSAGGIDGLSVEAFEERLKVNLEELRRNLIDKKWNPEPYLKVPNVNMKRCNKLWKNRSMRVKTGLCIIRFV